VIFRVAGSCTGREIFVELLIPISQQSLGVIKLLFEFMHSWGLGRADGWKGCDVARGSCRGDSVSCSGNGVGNYHTGYCKICVMM